MDVLRRELLYGAEGLPYGLLAAQHQFLQISYFWSSEFWFGLLALKSTKRKVLLASLTMVCGTIALLVGPSAALLVSPARDTEWWAGAAKVTFPLASDILWPSRLSRDQWMLGADFCPPAEGDLQVDNLANNNCSFKASMRIGDALGGSWMLGMGLGLNVITMTDGSIQREIAGYGAAGDRWAEAPHVPTIRSVRILERLWLLSILNAWNAADPGKFSSLRNRQRAGSVATLTSWNPKVRVACLVDDSLESFSNVTTPKVSYSNLFMRIMLCGKDVLTYWNAASIPYTAGARRHLS